VHDERLGSVDVPGMPIRFSAFPTELDLSAAPLGAHNEHIVRGVLGKDADTYERLVASGVLRYEPES
jgi:crotonobetainyl-CoA:carnitine CoA-transferase CaiB-like acyl-CoA transferase